MFDIDILLIGICFPLGGRRAGSERPRLFENPPDHNPPREPGREGDFLTYIARNPLKSPDSKK
jgi:hypothetical protein